jgi:transcriptional regulator with XRE-family HTH domain/uncharacterized protein (DUF1778 family)
MPAESLLKSFSLRMPQSLRDLLENLADASEQSLNSWLQSCLEAQFHPGSSSALTSWEIPVRNSEMITYPFRMSLELRGLLEKAAATANRSLQKEVLSRILCALSVAQFQKVAGLVLPGGPVRVISLTQLAVVKDALVPKKTIPEPNNTGPGLNVRLKAERRLLAKTQEQIAAACGVSREVWNRYEAGSAVPGAKILEAFVGEGANAQYLLSGIRDELILSDKEMLLVKRFRLSEPSVCAAALRMLDTDRD